MIDAAASASRYESHLGLAQPVYALYGTSFLSRSVPIGAENMSVRDI